jgi:hypothetical protein
MDLSFVFEINGEINILMCFTFFFNKKLDLIIFPQQINVSENVSTYFIDFFHLKILSVFYEINVFD